MKLALTFVNGMEPGTAIQLCSEAAVAAYKQKAGLFSRPEFEIKIAQVLDMPTMLSIKYNVEKFAIPHVFHTNDPSNPDPLKTVLAVGPGTSENLNRMSSGLRLF